MFPLGKCLPAVAHRPSPDMDLELARAGEETGRLTSCISSACEQFPVLVAPAPSPAAFHSVADSPLRAGKSEEGGGTW